MKMSPFYLILFFLLFVAFLQRKKEHKESVILKKLRKKGINMNEAAKSFIGKDCIVYLFDGNQIQGKLKEICGNAVMVDDEKTVQAINLDFIMRIREHPLDKNGKKKSFVFD